MRRNVPPQRFPRRYAAIYARLAAGEQCCRETLFNDLERFPSRSTAVADQARLSIINSDNYRRYRAVLRRVTSRSASARAAGLEDRA